MALSKKHYEQFAYDFKQQLSRVAEDHVPAKEKTTARAHLVQLATRMAVDFALDNPRFDRARFLAACGF